MLACAARPIVVTCSVLAALMCGRTVSYGGECTTVGEQYLAAAALLGRGTQDGDPATDRRGDSGQRQARTESGGAHDVVSAGVSHTEYRVVLAADHHPRSGRGTGMRGERRRQAERVPLHGEPAAREATGEQRGRVPFVVPGFGMAVQLV